MGRLVLSSPFVDPLFQNRNFLHVDDDIASAVSPPASLRLPVGPLFLNVDILDVLCGCDPPREDGRASSSYAASCLAPSSPLPTDLFSFWSATDKRAFLFLWPLGIMRSMAFSPLDPRFSSSLFFTRWTSLCACNKYCFSLTIRFFLLSTCVAAIDVGFFTAPFFPFFRRRTDHWRRSLLRKTHVRESVKMEPLRGFL